MVKAVKEEMVRGEADQTSRLLWELSSVIFAVVRSPQFAIPTNAFSSSASPGAGVARLSCHDPPPIPPRPRRQQASPAAISYLLLGVSMALMLGGSVTFVLGFMLMPWVLGLLTVLRLVGIISTLSGLGRAILFPSALKEVKGQLLSKLPTN